jgi:hypothetical protein
MKQPTPTDQRPRVEPEIIPPRARNPHATHATARIYVTRIGPLGALLLALGIGLSSVILLFILLGAVLIWIPVVGLIVAAAIVSSILRGHFRRAR